VSVQGLGYETLTEHHSGGFNIRQISASMRAAAALVGLPYLTDLPHYSLLVHGAHLEDHND